MHRPAADESQIVINDLLKTLLHFGSILLCSFLRELYIVILLAAVSCSHDAAAQIGLQEQKAQRICFVASLMRLLA